MFKISCYECYRTFDKLNSLTIRKDDEVYIIFLHDWEIPFKEYYPNKWYLKGAQLIKEFRNFKEAFIFMMKMKLIKKEKPIGYQLTLF